jgi:hypothetical protein
METRGNIHLNERFIKSWRNIYLYGVIKDEIEIFSPLKSKERGEDAI